MTRIHTQPFFLGREGPFSVRWNSDEACDSFPCPVSVMAMSVLCAQPLKLTPPMWTCGANTWFRLNSFPARSELPQIHAIARHTRPQNRSRKYTGRSIPVANKKHGEEAAFAGRTVPNVNNPRELRGISKNTNMKISDCSCMRANKRFT